MEIDLDIIHKAVEIVLADQCHPRPTVNQLRVVETLVNNKNSVNQLPTGSGKTWPVISLPAVLDVLRDNFLQDIPKQTRVLYIVSLVAIFHSLSTEMEALNVPHQILSAGVSVIDPDAKVVYLSPEKLLEKSVVSAIL